MEKLKHSKGCNQNRDLMVGLLTEIQAIPEGYEQLLVFLRKSYPSMIVAEVGQTQAAPAAVPSGPVFPYFNPGILTYPRRQVFEGGNLAKTVREFCLDKIKSDFVIVDGKAYVEYLERGDSAVAGAVPLKNWQIAAWRVRNGS